ncbi:unnamed protein product [Rotaria magnacalcarata]|nr:unnamed protein product [Rotaria magnacalcarata]CAF1422657.1 unnamed protein product [Rotaria magnacalcarata]CAF2147568.1 unnamed protein product [Rotaria magnacalcarata]
MQLLHVFILHLNVLVIYGKDYTAYESNRLHITQFYRNHLLTRAQTKNSRQTIVAVGLGIIEVEGIDPQKQVITLNVNMELRWCDEFLQWNTSEQLCITGRNRSEIFFTGNEIWTPDIVAINGPGKNDRGSKYQYPALVICTGIVRWSYQDKLVSYCKINVKNFPFDRQYCSILLQSTIYDSSELKLRSLYTVIQLYNLINTEWKILHLTIEEIDLYNPHYSRYFSTIKIDIELERHSRFYVLKIMIPFSVISILGLFSFCLPTDSGEKIALTVSVLLSLTIYLQLISDYVPKSERGLSLLTLYSNTIFSFVFLSCVFNICTIFIYYQEQFIIRNKMSKRKKNTFLLNLHKSLSNLNQQRWLSLQECGNVQECLSEGNNVNAIEILSDIRHIRELLMNLFVRENSTDFYQYVSSSSKRSVKQLAVLVDQILFFICLILMPLSMVLLFTVNNKSLASSTATNQLLDFRKTAVDPKPVFRGCPT